MRNVVLVCGGRDYGVIPRNTPRHEFAEAEAKAKLEREALFRALDSLHAVQPISLIVQGWARGADQIAHDWARKNGVESTHKKYQVTSSMWQNEGRAAGVNRNLRMYQKEKPDMVLAAPGGAGTANMIGIAQKGGTNVNKVELE